MKNLNHLFIVSLLLGTESIFCLDSDSFPIRNTWGKMTVKSKFKIREVK